MNRGIGIDASLGLSFAESRELAVEAANAGYASAWTPSGPVTRDGFHACAQWSQATASVVDGGIPVGIAVIPVPVWTIQSLASQAGTLSELTGGRFTLGLGTGGIYGPEYRRMHGVADIPVVRMMREYVTALRQLLEGKVVSMDGSAIQVDRLQVTGRALPVPIYLAALGPQMLRLAGEVADGVSLNWTAPAARAWCREQISLGAERAGRDPASVQVTEYIRVCIDDDIDAARRAFVRSFMGYALSRPGASKDRGYRGHFARMGFDAALNRIEERREAGASEAELIDLFPDEFLNEMGYFGPASGAQAALERLSEGLDHAIVRVVGVRPGMEAARAVLRACAPKS